jgi:hypothetical protein
MSNPDYTAEKHRLPQLWRPGQSGNPNGRPKGARSKLAEDFLKDLAESWKTQGKAALLACARDEPAKYIKVIADLLPREALIDIELDITVKTAQTALQAYRMLKGLPAAELKRLHHAENGDDN